MTWLDDLSVDDIERGEFPLKQLLGDSLYYPASGFDGDPVRHFSNIFQHFFYVDYSGTELHLNYELRSRGFNGYALIANRRVTRNELSPTSWRSTDIHNESGISGQFDPQKAFCRWMVFSKTRDVQGPERFSLLYLYADGIAAYQATYAALGIKPKGIAIIQSGHLSGNNWAIFPSTDGLLYKAVSQNSAGFPDYLLYGGFAPIWRSEKMNHRSWFPFADLNLELGAHDFKYDQSCWPEYSELLELVSKYDERHREIQYEDIMGVIGLWKKDS